MEDYRRVYIQGTCDFEEVPALARALDMGKDYRNFHCLVFSGAMSGLPNWASDEIEAIGNLAEKGDDENAVAKQLGKLYAIARTLKVKVHVGSPFEGEKCVATVELKSGNVSILPPEIEKIPKVPHDQMQQNTIMDVP